MSADRSFRHSAEVSLVNWNALSPVVIIKAVNVVNDKLAGTLNKAGYTTEKVTDKIRA
jgi:hypothetical protein